MKHLMAFFVVAGFVGWAVDTANAQNLLSNGTLDSKSISTMILASPTDWVASGERDGASFDDVLSSESFANYYVQGAPGDCGPTGTENGCGVFFKTFQAGSDPARHLFGEISQDVPGEPGKTYSLRAFAAAGPKYSGVDPNTVTETVLALDFLDAGSAVLGSSELELGPTLATKAGGATWPDRYTKSFVSGVAPAGTATVRARFSMIDGYLNPDVSGEGALVADYFLLQVPEPASMSLFALALFGLSSIRRRRD